MKQIKLLLPFIVSLFAFPAISMDRGYAAQVAQQEAAYQRLHPQVGGGMWMPYYNEAYNWLWSSALNVNSKIFPENKPTNDLKQILIDLEKEKYSPEYNFNRSSNYLNSRLPEIAWLLAQGADPNIIYRGTNLASEAIHYRNIALVNLLKNAPIKGLFDAKYPSGKPMWFNISSDRLEMLLQAQVIDVNQPDNHGNTALMNAIERHDLDSIRVLLRYHADPTIANEYGQTAVEAAQTEKLPANIIQLLQHAIDNPRKQKLL